MNKRELQNILIKKNIPETFFSLDGKSQPDRFEMRLYNNDWLVYYCDERGVKHDLKTFISEPEACCYFYDYISSNAYMSKFFV